jgi:hypothetical protein
VPFWISVVIRQERDLAVLGCQVSHLVFLNWPPAFSPPMLAQIYMGPEDGRMSFWRRMDWPWKSVVARQDDEVELAGSSTRTTSFTSTARSGLVEIVSPKGVYP